jgi:hypothetical protein
MQKELQLSINTITRQEVDAIEPNSARLSLYELEYFRQLKQELKVFLESRHFTIIDEIVLGVKGKNFRAIIPIKGEC